uniref:Uncharacterized protein n=1 Tax=Cannabis sativa TaxID=3483 RepID=A0A803R9D3_CANSA
MAAALPSLGLGVHFNNSCSSRNFTIPLSTGALAKGFGTNHYYIIPKKRYANIICCCVDFVKKKHKLLFFLVFVEKGFIEFVLTLVY